mgnify:CR=1 FL=1
MNFDNQQFNYWKDAKDREFKEKEFDFNKQQKELENAWKRVDELGYVDNDASTILGVKVGTLSGAAREAKEQREFELEKMREQLQIEHDNNVALTKLKVELQTKQEKELASYNNMLQVQRMERQIELDTKKSKDIAGYENMLQTERMIKQNQLETQREKELAAYKTQLQTQQSKELAAYENSLKQNNMKYEYDLASQYGGTTSNSKKTSNFSTYDDIIKNRYAEYDDFTKQYVVPDQKSYNELGNYLDTLYASGQITEEEFLQLSAKYSKYANQNSSQTSEPVQTQQSSNNNSLLNGFTNGITLAVEQLLNGY